MKKLSDYKDEEALDLWADLLEPMTAIIGDEAVANEIKSGKPMLIIARQILKSHAKEAKEIILRIDDTPIDGINIIKRLIDVLNDVKGSEDAKAFFESAE